MNQGAILVRGAPIAHKRIQVARVSVVVASAGAVHLAQTGDRKRLVLPLRLRRVGAIVEAVVMVVGICVSSVEPETREYPKRCSGQCEWQDSAG